MTNDIAQVLERTTEMMENIAAVKGAEFALLVATYSNALVFAQMLSMMVERDSSDERRVLGDALMTLMNDQLMVPFHDVPQARREEAFGLGKHLHSMAQFKA